MNEETVNLKGISAKILDTLENNQSLWKRFSLDPIADDLDEFLTEPNPSMAVSIIRRVLQKHGKDILADYMARLAKIETGVQRFDPRLRDHVNHSVYVFFLGLFLKSTLNKIKIGRPLSWKLAAFLHDVGYPIELFTRSTGEYLAEVHSLITDIVKKRAELRTPTHSLRIKDVENLVSGRNAFELMNSRLANWGLSLDLKQVYERKMKKGIVDHGILSSLVVLNIIDALYSRYNPNNLERQVKVEGLDWSILYYKRDILDAVSAIAAHNLTLDELKTSIVFENAPILYVLSLCDSLQVWNRYSLELQVYGSNSINFEFEGNQVLCSLALSDKDFKKVQDDINRLQSEQIILQLKQV